MGFVRPSRIVAPLFVSSCTMRSWSLLAYGLLVACGGASASPVATAPPGPAPATLTRCPASIDVPDLLMRHAHAYGAPLALDAALPHSLAGTLASGNQAGSFELVLDRARYRMTSSINTLRLSQGIYNQGTWSLGVTGVLVQLAPREAVDVAFEAWLMTRSYVDDPAADAACTVPSGPGARPIVTLRSRREDVGSPELRFDGGSAELISASFSRSDGTRSTRTFDGWSPPDPAGVRWPIGFADASSVGNETRVTIRSSIRGAHCQAGSAPQDGEGCFKPPEPRMRVHWPASGRVRVPMEYAYGELFIHARIGQRQVWALLDSGAGLSVIEARDAAGAGFKQLIEEEGQGLTQRVIMGLGELDSVAIGELELEKLPVASVPIPAFDDFGAKRPELVLGYSLFESMAVRIDYQNHEVVLARSADTLTKAESLAVPFFSLDGKAVVEGKIEGRSLLLEIDTGNNGTLDLTRQAAEGLGLLDGRPTSELHGRFGAGTLETKLSLLRVSRIEIGPIELNGSLTGVADRPNAGTVAAFVGNRALGACSALVMDFLHRSLWVDPPCAHAAAEETRVGWRLTRRDAPNFPDRPWVIGAIAGGSPAQLAGLKRAIVCSRWQGRQPPSTRSAL
jgi:hypothetical protein